MHNQEKLNQIEQAVERCVESWDMDDLVAYAIDSLATYMYHSACDEEVQDLLEEFGSES